MALAPTPISSAGWATNNSVPDHLSFNDVSTRAVPTKQVMWISLPILMVSEYPEGVLWTPRELAVKKPPACKTGLPTAPVAFSYVRFSTPEQAKGDSLRRQTEATEEWCRRNAIPLDTS